MSKKAACNQAFVQLSKRRQLVHYIGTWIAALLGFQAGILEQYLTTAKKFQEGSLFEFKEMWLIVLNLRDTSKHSKVSRQIYLMITLNHGTASKRFLRLLSVPMLLTGCAMMMIKARTPARHSQPVYQDFGNQIYFVLTTALTSQPMHWMDFVPTKAATP